MKMKSQMTWLKESSTFLNGTWQPAAFPIQTVVEVSQSQRQVPKWGLLFASVVQLEQPKAKGMKGRSRLKGIPGDIAIACYSYRLYHTVSTPTYAWCWCPPQLSSAIDSKSHPLSTGAAASEICSSEGPAPQWIWGRIS